MQTPCDICKQSSRPLLAAVTLHHNDCLDTILKEGASVEDKSEAFCSALACENFKSAEFLLDTGININFKSFCSNATPLMYAASCGQYGLVQKLISVELMGTRSVRMEKHR